MKYTPEDSEEFKKFINELLELGLICPSISPHNSPLFLLWNGAEQIRGKERLASYWL